MINKNKTSLEDGVRVQEVRHMPCLADFPSSAPQAALPVVIPEKRARRKS